MTLTMETSRSLNSKSFPVWVFIRMDMASIFSPTSSTITALPRPIRE